MTSPEAKKRAGASLLRIELLFEKLVEHVGHIACSMAQIHDSVHRIEYALTQETAIEDEPTNRDSPEPFPLTNNETGEELHPTHYNYYTDRFGDAPTVGGSTFSGGGFTDDTRRTK